MRVSAQVTGQIISQVYKIVYRMNEMNLQTTRATKADGSEQIFVKRSSETFLISLWLDNKPVAFNVMIDELETILIDMQPLYQNAVA